MSCNSSGFPKPTGLIQEAYLYSATDSFPRFDVRWASAELRTAELLSRIQPNGDSEKRRKAVAEYVKGLIRRCFDCQVFTFGSLPLKTYLPDGDIDLTAFSRHQSLKDTWASDVQSILESEEQRKDAEFRVREVQCIHAEVKIVKCLVENIVVDISFNQLGGLCTLCFLEEVDHLIQRDHLFKRSIILVKAWCYYESRLLGAHHGLLSTYALETLVLYIFNVFHTSLRGPLEVLFRFLDFFSNFDWEKYCVSLWGPVPLSSIPDLTAEPPVRDGGTLLLTKKFLEDCSDAYGVFPKGQDTQSRIFVEKYLNVVDPLRMNNNLGRSVSKANFFRIRSAFGLGARKMAKVFESPEDDFAKNLDNFFSNTWERHQSGRRPDAPDSMFLPFQTSNLEALSVHMIDGDSAGNSEQTGDRGRIYEPHSPIKSDLYNNKFAGGVEVSSSQSLPNKLMQIGKEVNSQLSAHDSCFLDSSSYVEEVLSFSESLSSNENQTDDSKLDRQGKEVTSTSTVDSKKNSPSRSKSLGKGLSIFQKLGEEFRGHMRRSTSDGGLEELSHAHVVNGSRLLGDAQDRTVQSDHVEDKSRKYFGKVSSAVEGQKMPGRTGTTKTRSDNSGYSSIRSTVSDNSVAVRPSVQIKANDKHGYIRSSNEKDRLASDLHARSKIVCESRADGQGSFDDQITTDSRFSISAKCKGLAAAQIPPDLGIQQPQDQSRPASVGPLAPVGVNMGKVNSSILESSLNVGVVPLHPNVVAVQMPRGPVPPPLPSYLGGVARTSYMQHTPYHLQNFEGVELQSHLWQQHEQEHLQQFQPWSSAVLSLPQEDAELNGFEPDITSRTGVTHVSKSIANGTSSGKDSKFVRAKGSGKELKAVDCKRSSANVNDSFHEQLLESVRVENVVRLARDEVAAANIGLRIENTLFEGIETIPSPALASAPVVLSNSLTYVPHHSVTTDSNSSGSDMHNFLHYPSPIAQPLDRNIIVPSVVPSQSTNLVELPQFGTQLPVFNTFQSPIFEVSSTSESPQESAISNQAVPGASAVYFNAGSSVPTYSFYSPFSVSAPGSDHGFGVELGGDLGSYITQDASTIDYLANSASQVHPGVKERLKDSNTAVSAGSSFASGSMEEANVEMSRDLLSSDFVSHRQNLAFGRWCQEPGTYSVVFSPSILQSPKYVQGHLFWEGPYRPHGDAHIPSQLPRNMQGSMPLVRGFGGMTGNMPSTSSGRGTLDSRKPQSGTGTFLPLRHGLYRDVQLSGSRYQQGTYNQDQGRSGNIGSASRQRRMGHGLGTDGHSQAHIAGAVNVGRHVPEVNFGDKNMWQASQHLMSAYPPFGSNLAAPSSPYGLVSGSQGTDLSGSMSRESGGMVSLPHSHTSGRVLPLAAGQLEFGSLGPVHVGTAPGENNLKHGVASVQHNRVTRDVTSSADFPSYPDGGIHQTSFTGHQRTMPRTYQLREDDFPPLPIHRQREGSSAISNGNNRISHE